FFFRYKILEREGALMQVQPLRVVLPRFRLSKSQRRILRRNADLIVKIMPTRLDGERRELFQRHRARFTEQVPDRLEDFLGWQPNNIPCENIEIGLYSAGALVAASYLDLGECAVSSVYAIFDPALSERSLGICTMLHELAYAAEGGFHYYYP